MACVLLLMLLMQVLAKAGVLKINQVKEQLRELLTEENQALKTKVGVLLCRHNKLSLTQQLRSYVTQLVVS